MRSAMRSTRSPATRSSTARRDGGSAVVEFVMIAVLLFFLVLAVLQMAIYLYVRNIVQASAAAGARRRRLRRTRRSQARWCTKVPARRDRHDLPCRGSPGLDVTGLPLAVVPCRAHLKSIFL